MISRRAGPASEMRDRCKAGQYRRVQMILVERAPIALDLKVFGSNAARIPGMSTSDEFREIAGLRVLMCGAEDPILSKPQDAIGLIALAGSRSVPQSLK